LNLSPDHDQGRPSAPAYRGDWLAVYHNGLGSNPIREADIETGLWTLRFLAITLAITLIRRIFGWNWIVNCRRILSLLTFAYACVHLSMWAAVDWAFDLRRHGHEIAKHNSILVGTTIWLLPLALAITSTKGLVRRLGSGGPCCINSSISRR